jgi:hypothetical protein
MYYDISVTPPKKMVEAYAKLVNDKLDNTDWEGYCFTFMFNYISASPAATIRRMHQIVRTVFSRLVTRIVNRPNTRRGKERSPIAIFFMDVPDGLRVLDMRDVLVNDGVHMHGVVMIPKKNRLKEPLAQHIKDNKALYLVGNAIHRIDVELITHSSDKATLYAGKAVAKRRFGYDDILVLC